ncbi:MAG: PASTA domain-containing protein [Prevotellaceae bacterium]|jgi:beta-lactam-binding protein with PASTA domain|nr:PASTA domain-containing protein [Prevotellaceae bacterium]
MKPVVKRLIIHFFIIIGVFIALIFLTKYGLTQFTRHGQTLTVPDFTGLTMAQAREVAKAQSLQLEVIDSIFLPNKARGTVFRQIPYPGEQVKKNRRIIITINSVLPRKAKAPLLVGFTLRQAKAELASQSFKVGRLTYVYDIATNTVLAQYCKGEVLKPGTPIEIESTIDLMLGVAPEHNKTYIPSVIGLTLENARDIITDYSLNLGRVNYDASVATSTDSLMAVVVRQSPEPSPAAVWNLGVEVQLYLTAKPPDIGTKREERP